MANTTYNARFHKCLETSGISNENLGKGSPPSKPAKGGEELPG